MSFPTSFYNSGFLPTSNVEENIDERGNVNQELVRNRQYNGLHIDFVRRRFRIVFY
ncbi:hypothetical protein HUG17_10664 [Dermatophagoides farinae]|uniref:Uncharacterized protein n=1 Tax=Dermatophagoides farinae TaxID=6954 RepID=A0A9D4NWT1_DERFA|nr:hypothetical protein HUG17_10664 [Dermatophagoides farinae]